MADTTEHISKNSAAESWQVLLEQKEQVTAIRLLKSIWAVVLNQALGEGDGTAGIYQAVVRDKHSGDEVLRTPLRNLVDTEATVTQIRADLSTLSKSDFLNNWHLD